MVCLSVGLRYSEKVVNDFLNEKGNASGQEMIDCTLGWLGFSRSQKVFDLMQKFVFIYFNFVKLPSMFAVGFIAMGNRVITGNSNIG